MLAEISKDSIPLTQPRDRVIHADRWQGTLDSPSAEDEAWLAANSEDWAGYAEWSRRLEEMYEEAQWQDRLEQMHWSDGDLDIQATGLPVS